ncbi:MAG TPA: hypothetical protein VH351_06885 [Bryobacteraceae bacterium]|jgi:hypothetical protein|nr:hypothetical protein [Bryobacteraceae bacterium]
MLSVWGTLVGCTALLTVFAANGVASCAAAAQAATGRQVFPGFATVSPQDQTRQPDADEQLSASEDSRDSNSSIVGFWKTTFIAGGLVMDVGFDQFHPDGTEISVDSPAPSFGNICNGVWERTGRRQYSEVHPAFNWDASSGKVVSIFIQRVEIRVSHDGKNFSGTFTWDSYDFNGNPLPDTHSEGSVTGERITVKGPFPFPFPF